MVSFVEDIDGKLTCPRLWSSHKSAFRGSCTSEPSRGEVTKTTGVGGDAGRATALAANSSGVRYFSELCGRTVL
jgi:hypothetical protein